MDIVVGVLIGFLAGAGLMYVISRKTAADATKVAELISAQVVSQQTEHILQLAETKLSAKKDVIDGSLLAMKNDLTRERPIVGDTDPPARQPTASQTAAAGERWDELVGGLNPTHRQVLEMLRDGYTHAEIGLRLGFHKKTVQRLLQRLEGRA